MIDYCTLFPENWRGVYIGLCCKGHDSDCSTSRFYVSLYKAFRSKLSVKESKLWATVITTGGAFGCWVKYTSKMWRRMF